MKQLVLFFAITSLMASCATNSETLKVLSLPKQIVLEPTVHRLSDDASPSAMYIKNDKLILLDSRIKDYFLKVFDLKSKNLLYQFGTLGRASNEFVQIGRIMNTGEGLEVVDMGTKIKYIEFGDTCANCTIIAENAPFGLNPRANYNLIKMNDSIYLMGNEKWEEDKLQLKWYNIRSDQSTPFVDIEKDYFDFMGTSGSIVDNRKDKKLMIFYTHSPVYKIVDFDGKLISRNQIKESVSNSETIATINSSERNGIVPDIDNLYCTNFVATKNFIFAEFLNTTMMKSLKLEQSNIVQFDWDGNVIGNYLLNDKVRCFTVSDDETTIYASPRMQTEPVLYEYQIPAN